MFKRNRGLPATSAVSIIGAYLLIMAPCFLAKRAYSSLASALVLKEASWATKPPATGAVEGAGAAGAAGVAVATAGVGVVAGALDLKRSRNVLRLAGVAGAAAAGGVTAGFAACVSVPTAGPL